MTQPLAPPDPWQALTRFTQARIGLGRVGASLPTSAVLAFAMEHAHARDAIQHALPTEQLAKLFADEHLPTLPAWSQAHDRADYLRRPDLGRRLAPACIEALKPTATPNHRLTIVVADGLSALAATRHSLPVLKLLRDQLTAWQLDTILLATQARVALGDEIGALRHAEAVLVLIGERPGLQSPDSLGIYLTYRPRIGLSDADRNCISNIRPAGLSYEQAAQRCLHLLNGARALNTSGIALKDTSSHILLG